MALGKLPLAVYIRNTAFAHPRVPIPHQDCFRGKVGQQMKCLRGVLAAAACFACCGPAASRGGGEAGADSLSRRAPGLRLRGAGDLHDASGEEAVLSEISSETSVPESK